MTELTYEDFKQQISIQELLQDAGYHLNRRDGLRNPSYVRLDSEGRRVRGDKFIVTRNGFCCFQPPEQKNYNVISFIKEHPEFFPEYTPGMSKDRLVNLVCNRLLGQPAEQRWEKIVNPAKQCKPFRMADYETQAFVINDWESQKKFYPYFKSRGINLTTQRMFSDHFLLSTRQRTDGKRYTNLSFPMTVPGKPNETVGLEERSRPNQDGKTAYKGMAAGSDATHGLWIANLNHKALAEVKDVYWFESAFDAMAYYQLHDKELRMDESVFVSTGGSPSQLQFKGMLAETPNANHHLCFDRDRAGRMFAVNFALTHAGKNFSTHLTKTGQLVVLDSTEKYQRHELDLNNFDFGQTARMMGIGTAKLPYREDMAAYVSTLESWENPLSGDPLFLPQPISNLYGCYERLEEEYHSARSSRLVCQEDLEDMKKETTDAFGRYKAALQEALSGLPKERNGYLLYETAAKGYKDWNDQLLDKKMEAERTAEEEKPQAECRNTMRQENQEEQIKEQVEEQPHYHR